METLYWVSILAQFFTYASFLSSVKLCHTIHSYKSSDAFSLLPFLAALSCSVLWLQYGLIVGQRELKIVNTAGAICSTLCIGFFVFYSQLRARITKQITIVVTTLVTLIWLTNYSAEPLFLSGSLASMSSMIFCAAPLATISDVIKTHCTASLPFPIIVSSFSVSLSWLVYGLLKDDGFIIFTNVISTFISGAQLLLFAIYPSSIPYEKITTTLPNGARKPLDLLSLLYSDDNDEPTILVDCPTEELV